MTALCELMVSELRSCVKKEVDREVGSPSLIVRTVSVDVNQY